MRNQAQLPTGKVSDYMVGKKLACISCVCKDLWILGENSLALPTLVGVFWS